MSYRWKECPDWKGIETVASSDPPTSPASSWKECPDWKGIETRLERGEARRRRGWKECPDWKGIETLTLAALCNRRIHACWKECPDWKGIETRCCSRRG